MIDVQGLRHAFGGRHAVRDLSLHVERGTVTGFLGRNGAGKTTTLRAVAGVLVPDAGQISVAGLRHDQQPREARRRVGYLPERAALVPELSVGEQLTLLARLRGLGGGAVDGVIERLGLGEVRDRLIGSLSKGWRQRAALAAAIVHRPDVVLLDEPMSGLDPAQRREVRRLFAALAEEGAAVLFSSHVLAEVEEVCSRVLIMHDGRLVADHHQGASPSWAVSTLRHDGLEAALAAVPGVDAVQREGEGYTVRAGPQARPQIAAAACPFGLLELRPARTLEAVWAAAVGEGP